VRVDYHHHAILPGYRARLDGWGLGAQPGVPFPEWTPGDSLRWMDFVGVERALLSVGSPGFFFGDAPAAVALTDVCNAELAALRDGQADRFGVFAAVPLPDLEAALVRVERCLVARGFDGVGLLTQYGGTYLGDPAWDELYALLNDNAALVHVHPTVPHGWDPARPVRPSLLEYPFETTRVIVELARQRVFTRYPAIEWVFSHGGGTIAALADRITGNARGAPVLGGDRLDDVTRASRFDSALVGAAGLAALAMTVGPERVVFGSDVPFVGADHIARDRAALGRLAGGRAAF
jgi:predicted TIM-barrel fold metal-dependent hydrolase